jgi:phosphoenolpyruvate phosphomutase
MTEMPLATKPIVEAVTIPVWVDVDTGYGNFVRTVREFEKIGAYGISIEDNLPGLKQNSLWGDKIDLMDMEAFGDKLNGIAWDDRKIKIIARTEAIIRGYGAEEAIKRLTYYKECGADIVLPHARDKKDIITPFDLPGKYYKELWAIVPTKFPELTNSDLFNMGYNLVIWANQTERVKIKAIRECLGSIMGSGCAGYVEANLSATLDDLKGLTPDV